MFQVPILLLFQSIREDLALFFPFDLSIKPRAQF